jgi:hypothetical protein
MKILQMIIIFWEMTPCGSYSQKMIIIIVTAVETSNLTRFFSFTRPSPLFIASRAELILN